MQNTPHYLIGRKKTAPDSLLEESGALIQHSSLMYDNLSENTSPIWGISWILGFFLGFTAPPPGIRGK